jgi:copper resistance protein C
MTSIRRGRVARATLALTALAALALPAAVSAHAELDTMTPADKSTTQGSPTEIVATFTEDHLGPSGNSLVLLDAGGAIMAQGGTVSSDRRSLTLTLTTPLQPGTYTIRWTSKSDEDGDVARGKTTFTVAAAASEPPSSAPSSTPLATDSSIAPSVAATPAPSPSAAPAPATSTSDAVIPVVVALIVLLAIGGWLFRGRMAGRR